MSKKILFLGLGFLLISCAEEERCGDIIDKITQDGRYFFIFDPNSNLSLPVNGNDSAAGFPDNRLSGEVSRATYDRFSIGEEYCQ